MIEHEIAYVRRAVEDRGNAVREHLETKGFVDHWFLFTWAAVVNIINTHGFGPRVLDLGCGSGWSSIFLAGRGLQVTGLDVSPDMIAIARQNAARLGMTIDFRVGDMQQFDEPEPYDSALVLDALHHCEDERPVLQSILKALRPGGKLLIVEPDWFHAFSPHSRYARQHYGVTERGLSYRRLRRSLKATGFGDLDAYYSVFAPARRSLHRRLLALGVVLLTVTSGFPRRPTVVLAQRPAAA